MNFKNSELFINWTFLLFGSVICNLLNAINQPPRLRHCFVTKYFHMKEDTEAVISKTAEYVQWNIPSQ